MSLELQHRGERRARLRPPESVSASGDAGAGEERVEHHFQGYGHHSHRLRLVVRGYLEQSRDETGGRGQASVQGARGCQALGLETGSPGFPWG